MKEEKEEKVVEAPVAPETTNTPPSVPFSVEECQRMMEIMKGMTLGESLEMFKLVNNRLAEVLQKEQGS